MDWQLVIDRNAAALGRILALLFAMAGLPAASGAAGHRAAGQGASAPANGDDAPAPGGVGHSAPSGRLVLPRRLHRAVLRLLRPAESAARRLLVVAARDVAVVLPPRRRALPALPGANPAVGLLRRLGIAVVVPPGARLPRSARRTAPGQAAPRASRLPLADRPRRPDVHAPRGVPAHAAPRLTVPGRSARRLLPAAPTPEDRLDATRLCSRLRAVAAVLSDLPGEALRFARWHARRALRVGRRPSPLRLGRPPGSVRRPVHEVHEVLADLHHFAREVLADTS